MQVSWLNPDEDTGQPMFGITYFNTYNYHLYLYLYLYLELARSLSSWTSIVGGIAVAFIVFLFVFCCYRRYKRRRMFEQQPLVHSGAPAATVIHPDPNAGYPVQPASYPNAPLYPNAPSYPNVPPGYGGKKLLLFIIH